MDLEKIANHIGMEKEVEETVTETLTATKPARVKEVSYSIKVTPVGTYSSVEFSQVLEVNTDNKDIITGIKKQLREEVISGALEAADILITSMRSKGMLK